MLGSWLFWLLVGCLCWLPSLEQGSGSSPVCKSPVISIFILDERHMAIKQSKGHNITTLNTIFKTAFFFVLSRPFPFLSLSIESPSCWDRSSGFVSETTCPLLPIQVLVSCHDLDSYSVIKFAITILKIFGFRLFDCSLLEEKKNLILGLEGDLGQNLQNLPMWLNKSFGTQPTD